MILSVEIKIPAYVSFQTYYITYYHLHILSKRGDSMASYVSPEVREKFETLSIDLKNNILERNVKINNVYDLINVLEKIVSEEDQSFWAENIGRSVKFLRKQPLQVLGTPGAVPNVSYFIFSIILL